MPLVTLDFNAIAYSAGGDPLATHNGNLFEDGFTVDNLNANGSQDFGTLRSSNGYNRHDSGDDVPSVTFQGFINGQPTGLSNIRVTKDDGAIFDLVSLQLDTRDTGSGGMATITGLKSDGVTIVTHVVNLDTILSLQTFVLPDTFRDLIRFDIEGPVNFQFNDIILRTYTQGTAGPDTFNVVDSSDVAYRALGNDDTINFGTFFSNGDIVDGGTGTDTISFSGGLSTTLGSGTVQNITNVEILKLLSGSYNLTMADIFVASGQTLTVDASALTAAQALTLNGAAETNGKFAITGGLAADNLTGGSGDDFFNGNIGADTMTGGLGNDTYLVDNAGDVVNEGAGQGNDTVYALASYTLAAGQQIEVLSLFNQALTTALDLTGNAFSQTIIGNAGSNILNGAGGTDVMYGLGGNDSYLVWTAADLVVEGAGQGNDTVYALVSYTLAAGQEIEVLDVFNRGLTSALNLTGNNLGQTIIGNAGANLLNGGGGADTFYGLGGNDTYVVDSASDFVAESAGGGSDTVLAQVSYALAAGQEVEVLDVFDRGATSALSLTGNGLAQTIIGNAGNNGLSGAGGTDVLYGLTGNDSYLVWTAGDFVVEAAGQGSDTVYAMVSYALAAGQEIEVLDVFDRSLTSALNLTGNGLAQTLIGNAGNNVLNGAGGTDIMYGLAGNDSYLIWSGGDVVVEAAGQGNDTIFALTSYALANGQEIEVMDVFDRGGTGVLNMTGNAFGQTLIGNAGSNILNGAGGSDAMYGLGGADTFAFTTALGGGNIDLLADFNAVDDTIALDDALFAGIGGPGAFLAGAFANGAAATVASHRIIYNQAAGQLLYDADGSGAGAAILFATLNPGTALTAADFTVI